jgi:hypothetical protein
MVCTLAACSGFPAEHCARRHLTPSPDIPENVNIASLTRSDEFNSYSLGE